MLRKLVINQAKMLHCFEECASYFPQKNSQHASLQYTEFGAIGLTHPPHVKS